MSKRLVPFLVVGVFAVYLAACAMRAPIHSAATSGFNLAQFRRLPVSVGGRVQPFDTAARLALMRLRGSSTVPLDGQLRGAEMDADEWLLELLARPDAADTRRVFEVNDPRLASKLALKAGEAYSFRDFATKAQLIGLEAQRLGKVAAQDRSAWERELLDLQARLVIYERLKNSVQPNSLLQLQAKGGPVTYDFAMELGKFRADLSEAFRIAGLKKNGGKDTLDRATEMRIRAFAARFQVVSTLGMIAVIPGRAGSREPWKTTGAAIVNGARGNALPMSVAYIAAMTSAYARGDAAMFNNRLARYRDWLAANGHQPEVGQADSEAFYNVFQPFIRAIGIYAVGLGMLLVAWRTRSPLAYRSAVLVVLLAFALQTTGLVFAIKLAGRPSLMAFAGWAIALAALVVEALRRRGLAICVAAATASIVLVASHATAPGGAMAIVRTLGDVSFLMATAVAVVAVAVTAIRTRPWLAGDRWAHSEAQA